MQQAYENQRVGIFVDVQNLYYSAKHLYKAKVNYFELMKRSLNSRKLIRAIAYVVKADELGEEKFFEALRSANWEVKSKDLQIFPGGQKKGDWDVGLAVDAIELGPKLDVVVIVSGDGDYVPLVDHLKRAVGCRVEVVAFGKSTSAKLKEAADLFADLDETPEKFLIRDRKKK
ncbi:MAG: NYN domain-containing protein [Candidatus Aenigmarchaeota archaeon]|nr:NYN domain-containing protein [Candidatus Aenigmarchaeota archaeon]